MDAGIAIDLAECKSDRRWYLDYVELNLDYWRSCSRCSLQRVPATSSVSPSILQIVKMYSSAFNSSSNAAVNPAEW